MSAWQKDKPANDALLTNFPANCRANWDALELLTDAALQIDNAKVAAAAGIVDTKLATISTAGKVQGDALTLLGNVPAGAGTLPSANSPNKLKADASDTTPQYLDSLINTSMFEVSAGDLLELKDGGIETEKLESGSASPGNSKYYGTNDGGTKGFFSLPDVPSGGIILWSGAISNIPSGYVICDGNNGTPNLTDRFVIHADADSGGTNDVGDTGDGSIPSHSHSISSGGAHTHDLQAQSGGSTGAHLTYSSEDYSLITWPIKSAGSHDHGGSSGSYGSGSVVKAKYYALAYIQKT